MKKVMLAVLVIGAVGVAFADKIVVTSSARVMSVTLRRLPDGGAAAVACGRALNLDGGVTERACASSMDLTGAPRTTALNILDSQVALDAYKAEVGLQ